MIIARAPVRISLAGGGTDVNAFHKRRKGLVLCSTIDKYIYVILEPTRDFLKYAAACGREHISMPLIVREACSLLDIDDKVPLLTLSDVVSQSGLGSSSSLTVGVLHALHALRGDDVDAEQLSAEACTIEIDRLGAPIGKQDQYIAAYGGIRRIHFNPDGSVNPCRIECGQDTLSALEERLVLIPTGVKRSGVSQLSLSTLVSERFAELSELGCIASAMCRVLSGSEELDAFGELMHRSWLIKRRLTASITNERIDALYACARSAGALGGKLCGAGGGGFMLFVVNRSRRSEVLKALQPCQELPFHFSRDGSAIIYAN